MVQKVSGSAQAKADTYADLRSQLLGGSYSLGSIIHVESPDGPAFVVKKGVETDDAGMVITQNGGTTSASELYAERYFDGVVHVEWFGATADGSTDDTTAIINACNYIQNKGGGVIDFGGSDKSYVIRDDTDSIPSSTVNGYRTMAEFLSLDGIEIRSSGANLILARDYTGSERDIVFRFQQCKNIKIGTFYCTYTGTRSSQPNTGGVLAFFRHGNTNVQVDDQYVDDWSICIHDNPGNNTDEFTTHWSGKSFTIYAKNTGYPYITDNGGTNLNITVDAEDCTRACTFQDVRNAKARIKSKDFQGSNDCGLSGTLHNIDFEYYNTENSKTAQDDCVSLQYASEYNTDVPVWTNAHDGANNASTLTDTAQSFTTNALVGYTIYNDSDNSSGTITANTATTVTATLSGGYENVWDTGDKYHIAGITGTHDGSNNASVLTDSGASWPANKFVGWTIRNTTDGSWGVITANTSTTVTATLENGAENDWDSGDTYTIGQSHTCTNVRMKSHVETYGSTYVGKPLFMGLGVGATESERDPGYVMKNITLSLTLIAESGSQESLTINDVSPYSDGKNLSGLKIVDTYIEGGAVPSIDLDMLIDSAAFINVVSDKQLQIANCTTGKYTCIGGKFPSSSTNTSDTSNGTLIGCDITNSSIQSTTNKAFFDCLLDGEVYQKARRTGQVAFSSESTKVISDSSVTSDTIAKVYPADNAAGTTQSTAGEHIVRKSTVAGTSITIGSANGNSVSGTFRYVLEEMPT